jgi:hypothetical protein
MKFSWFLWELLGTVVSPPLLLWFLQPPVRRLQVLKEKTRRGKASESSSVLRSHMVSRYVFEH